MSSKTWAGILGVTAVAAGAVIFYMAMEDSEIKIKYDPKVHSREYLIQILLSFEIEYASLYLHWYDMLRSKAKEVGKANIPVETLDTFRIKVDQLTESVDSEVFEEYKISQSFLNNLMEKYQDDAQVKDIMGRLKRSYDKLFLIERPEFKFDYPKELTKELYLKFLQVSYAKFRYDVYHAIQKCIAKKRGQPITEADFNEVIKECSLPETKNTVYRILKIPVIQNERPTRTTLKAYLSIMLDNEAWHSSVLHLQKEHKKILFDMANGEKMKNMDDDPVKKLDRELKFEESKKSAQPKVIEMMNSVSSHDESDVKKSASSFSFLGSEDKQQEMIKEFLERNKKKPQESKKQDPVNPEPKVAEVKEEETKQTEDVKEPEPIVDVKEPEPIVDEPAVVEQSVVEDPVVPSSISTDNKQMSNDDEPAFLKEGSEEDAKADNLHIDDKADDQEDKTVDVQEDKVQDVPVVTDTKQ